MELADDGEKFGGTAKARQDFPQCITADGIKGLRQVYEICIETHVLFSAFLLYLPQHEDHVYGPSVGPEPTFTLWRVFPCYRRMSLFSETRAKTLPAMESRVMPRWFEQSGFSPLFLYRETMTASLRSCGRVPFSQQCTDPGAYRALLLPRSDRPAGMPSMPGDLPTFSGIVAFLISSRMGGSSSSSFTSNWEI